MLHQNLIMPFIQNNWIWLGLLLALLAYYLFFEFQNLRYKKYMISPQNLVQLINKDSAQILDLRPKKFFDDAHIAGAINIEYQELLKNQSAIAFEKNLPIVLFSGYESDGRKVLETIKNQNFERIYILSGGALEWKRLNYPFVSGSSKSSKSSNTPKNSAKKLESPAEKPKTKSSKATLKNAKKQSPTHAKN